MSNKIKRDSVIQGAIVSREWLEANAIDSDNLNKLYRLAFMVDFTLDDCTPGFKLDDDTSTEIYKVMPFYDPAVDSGSRTSILYAVRASTTSLPITETNISIWPNKIFEYDNYIDPFTELAGNDHTIQLDLHGVYLFKVESSAVQTAGVVATLTLKMYVDDVLTDTRTYNHGGNAQTAKISELFHVDARAMTMPKQVRFTITSSVSTTATNATSVLVEFYPE